MIIYLDDILIYSEDMEKHKEHVRKVLERLHMNGLYAKLEKCSFHTHSTEFLGYVCSPVGISTDKSKTQVIADWPALQNVKEVQSFLGFANFYRRFINNYSETVIPLTRLTRKNVAWRWNEECQAAFELLKADVTSAPVLAHFNPELPIMVETDASDHALGAIISNQY
jgi:hypothetical protein